MKLSSIFITLLLVFPAACQPHAIRSGAEQSKDPFTHCDFTVKPIGNHYLSVGKVFRPSCEIGINATGIESHILGGMHIVFRIVRPNKFIDAATDSGFRKYKDWTFAGYTFGNPPFHFKNLETSIKESGGDRIYIGRQIGSSASSKGVTYVFDGISIIRQSPTFGLYSRMAFEPNTPPALVKAVEAELVEIVESVKVPIQVTATNPPTH